MRAIAVLPVLLILSACTAAASTNPVADSTPQPRAASGSTEPAPRAEPSQASANRSPFAGSTPAGRAAPAPGPADAASPPSYGVLVDLLTSPSFYLANVVAADGRVWASLKLNQRTPISRPGGHAIDLPHLSTSSTALYVLDGDSKMLAVGLADGRQTAIAELPVGPGMEGAFAVSPDDRQIAISVLDFNRSPVHVRLFTGSPTGGSRNLIFESDTDYVWPVAWHSGLLVLAHALGPFLEDVARSGPGQDNPYSAISYHLADPLTADRIRVLGGCTVSGPLSPAGSACIQGAAIDWEGNASPPWSTRDWGSISSAAALSPDGALVAAAEPDDQARLALWRRDGSIAGWVEGPGSRDWAGWLDATHVLIGSATRPDWRTRIVTLGGGPSPAIFLDVHGFYAAQLPTNIV